MKQRRQTTHAIDFLFTITLLAFFAISALLAVVIGARVYERITENISLFLRKTVRKAIPPIFMHITVL